MKQIILLLFSCIASAVSPCQAQELVRGQVKDSKNNVLAGVTISIKGTNKAAVTDENGKFAIPVNKQHITLTASYTGFISQEIDLDITPGASAMVVFKLSGVAADLKYWCCTDHASPTGPHCDVDKEVLKIKFKCQNFERQ